MITMPPIRCGRAAAAKFAANAMFLRTRHRRARVCPISKAEAMKIQEVKSPGGITAWLVEEHGIPLIAMRFAFEGGNAQDPDAKEGVANFLAGMMDEGAGELTAQAIPGAHGGDRHAHGFR